MVSGFESSSLGKRAKLSWGSLKHLMSDHGLTFHVDLPNLNKYGVHGPWMDGKSVCISFRNRTPLRLDDWDLSKLSHLRTSSSVNCLAFTH